MALATSSINRFAASAILVLSRVESEFSMGSLSSFSWLASQIIPKLAQPYLCDTSYIILLYPDERRPTTVRSNDTLVDTPFQLISGFFHVNQGVLCC